MASPSHPLSLCKRNPDGFKVPWKLKDSMWEGCGFF